ncbi:MAG: hypothetical protein ACRCY4_04275 [Brevinema sp.]
MPTILFIISLLALMPTQAQSKKLDASYKIGKDLRLLQTMGDSWYDTKDRKTWDSRGYRTYKAIYWNPKDNSYYFAHGPDHSLYLTNGLTYKLDLSKQETNYTIRESKGIIYVGSLSPLERLYIDKKNTNIQYIKRLIKFTDPQPIYPLLPETNDNNGSGESMRYTNKAGRIFSRSLYSFTYTNSTLKIDEYYGDYTDSLVRRYNRNLENFAPNDKPLRKAIEALISKGYVPPPDTSTPLPLPPIDPNMPGEADD